MEVDVIGIPHNSVTNRSLVRQYVEKGGDISSLIRSTGYPGHRATARVQKLSNHMHSALL